MQFPGARSRPGSASTSPACIYGECNQICGTNHSRMPIVVRAVPQKEFEAWVTEAKTKFSDAAPATGDSESNRACWQRQDSALTRPVGA